MRKFSFSVRHIFQLRFWPHGCNCHVILHQHAIFHPYRITPGGDMTSYRFSRWWLLWRNFTSGFLLGNVTFFFSRSMSISVPNIVRITQPRPRYIYFRFGKKPTFAILKFYFRFRFRLYLHNRSAQYYFRFRICWRRRLQKVKIYQQTKFRRQNSIHSLIITTSGLEKQTYAILEFYYEVVPPSVQLDVYQ